MYCRICGVLNKDGANFCKRCGAPFKGEPLKIQDAPSPIGTQDACSGPPAEDIGNDYLVPNIFVTLLGCMIPGVVGCCFSVYARDLKRRGDWEEAKKNAKNAKTMFWFTLTLEALGFVVFIVSGGLEVLYVFFWIFVKTFVFLDPPI